jgi:hypothetical protein
VEKVLWGRCRRVWGAGAGVSAKMGKEAMDADRRRDFKDGIAKAPLKNVFFAAAGI